MAADFEFMNMPPESTNENDGIFTEGLFVNKRVDMGYNIVKKIHITTT